MVNKYLKGGKSEGMTLSQVAKVHNMNAEQLKPQLRKGIKHELEHTRNLKEARRIALDHLVEFPDYYDRLDKIEKMHLGGDMSKHLAPNGKPSNLTHKQWHLVRTPEFKAWFGDWENDPENSSKVVDENGEPLVVYHGTISNFNVFNKENIGKNDYGYFGKGFYFGDFNSAEAYSQTSIWNQIHNTVNPNGRILKCFLFIKNPLVGNSKSLMQSKQSSDNFTQDVIKKHDGIISIPYQRFSPNTEYVVFEPNQIKLADGTNTTFDSGNPDIRFEKGGLIAPNGKPSNLTPQQYDLVRTPEFKAWFGDWENDPENASKVRDENGEPLVVYRGYPKKRKFPFVFEYKYRMFGKSGVAGREKNEFAFYFTDLKKVAENYGENLADDDEAFVVKEYFLNIRNIFKAYSRKNQYEITFKELYDLANKTGKPIYELNPDNEVALFYQKNEKGQYEMLPREYWNYDYSTINRYRDSEPKETFAYFVDWDKNSSNQFFWGSYLRRYLKYDGLVFYERTHNSLMNPDRDKNDYHSIEKPWVIPQFGDEFSKTYAVFESNQIKLADGTNTTFDGKNPDIRFDKGGRTIAQTPAPASDRVYGSKTNPKGSASDSELAKSIKFNDKLEKAIQNKVDEFNDKHPSDKVSLSTAKAIVRRGMGAYSKSHRPTISGGAPNSRQAWGLARLNKFLLKKSGVKVKKAYVQDDDLLKYAKGGKINMGDCYEVAGRMALMEASKAPNGEIFLGQPKVVHGEVAGQGSLEGIRYGHAWVEDDVYVYDFSNGRELMILKEVYYYLGKIMQEKPKLYKYTFKEATKKMVESRNFGPWDLITESGL